MSDHTSPETRLENIESTLNCIAESLERLVIAADSIATALSLQTLAKHQEATDTYPHAFQSTDRQNPNPECIICHASAGALIHQIK